jgi:aryl-alcohol dehydrogenase-like predicted oxidoreductase
VRTVDYRDTPDGTLRVSAIGIGTYALAGVYGEKDVDEFKEVLRGAFDRGVTLFDTSPVYGNAEDLIGEVLADVRQDVVLSTKVAARLERLSCSFDNVVASCEESLKRLRTDYIDLYQIHFDDGRTPTEEVVRALDHLKASGKIRAYGIGHVSPERAGQYMEKGGITTIMGELNAVSRSYYGRMLPLVRRMGGGYIGFSLTARGILTGTLDGRDTFSDQDIRRIDAVFAGERLKSALRVRDRLAQIGTELNASSAQVAIGWALTQEGVLTGLVGPSTVAHLGENLAAGDLEIPDLVLAAFDAFLGEEAEQLKRSLTLEVRSILENRIADRKDVPKLIYAIEGLADLGLAPEVDLLTHIRSVMKTMKSGDTDIALLDRVRQDLSHYLDKP